MRISLETQRHGKTSKSNAPSVTTVTPVWALQTCERGNSDQQPVVSEQRRRRQHLRGRETADPRGGAAADRDHEGSKFSRLPPGGGGGALRPPGRPPLPRALCLLLVVVVMV